MQRTNNKKASSPRKFTRRLKRLYSKMSIKNKIALIYSLVFILIIFVVSCFIIINSINYYRSISMKEINETLDKIETYIKEGNDPLNESVNSLNSNPFIVVAVNEIRDGKLVLDNDRPNGRRGPNGKPNDLPGDKKGGPQGNPGEKFGENSAENNEPLSENSETEVSEAETNSAEVTETETETAEKSQPTQQKRTINDRFMNDPNHDPAFRTDNFDGDAYMYTSRQVTANGKQYLIRVFRIYNNELNAINTMSLIFIIENLIAVIIAFVVGRTISSKMLQPVHQVANAAMKISDENFNQRIEEPEADDEIRELVHAFNDMLERLQISFERQNQFISDVSHELKTPISVIKGYTNLLSRWGKDDEEVLNEAIDSISSETEHMSMLISRLLFWARNDVNSSINMSELCLEELLDEIKKEAEVMELPAQINISGNASTRIDGDYHLIKQLIWIFVENAVKYSGEKNCVINFKTELDNNRAVLRIKDNGIGIKQEDIKNIFERFYRSDKSRNKEISGFGLGLSIAKWIVEHHNGKISVESTVGEGTEFILSFPIKK